MAKVVSTWSATEGTGYGLVPVRVHVLLARGEPGISTARPLGSFSAPRVAWALEAIGAGLPGRLVVDMSPGDAHHDMEGAHLAVAAAAMALSGKLDEELLDKSMFTGDLLVNGEVKQPFPWRKICAAAESVGAEPVLAASLSDLPRALGADRAPAAREAFERSLSAARGTAGAPSPRAMGM